MDKAKLQRKLEQQTVRDRTNMRAWRRRRYLRYEATMNQPILPRFCGICFFGMLAGPAAAAVFDIYASFAYLSRLGTLHMLQNAATSAFFCWLLFALPLAACALYQLKKGFSDPYFETQLLKRNGKPRMLPQKRFRMYVWVSVTGCAALFVLYWLTGILSSSVS